MKYRFPTKEEALQQFRASEAAIMRQISIPHDCNEQAQPVDLPFGETGWGCKVCSRLLSKPQ